MAQITSIEYSYTRKAVKLTEQEVQELLGINKVLDMKTFYFLTFLSVVLGCAWFLWVNPTPQGLLNVCYVGILLIACMLLTIPIHTLKVRRFAKRIGITSAFFSEAVLLDMDGNELSDQSR
jgi:hypothetical protein